MHSYVREGSMPNHVADCTWHVLYYNLSHSSIISPKFRDTDAYNFLNIPGYFMYLSAFKFSNVHIPPLWGRKSWQNLTLLSIYSLYHLPQENLTSLSIPSPSKVELDVLPLCSHNMVYFN